MSIIWAIEKRLRKKEKQGNKDAEAEAKRLHDAELQYALATASTSGQIAIMTRELNGVTKGSAEYYQILTRIVGLQKSEANEAKQLSAAKLQWELAQADKGGQIAIWKRELSAVTEGTQEWYDISTKIIQLQKAGGGGGGGAGVPANLDKFKADLDAKMKGMIPTFPKINWEDVIIPTGSIGQIVTPGLKTKLNDMGKELITLIIGGMKVLPDQLVQWAADLKAALTSPTVETAVGNAASDFGEWLVSDLGAYLGLSEPRALTAGSITAHLVEAVSIASEGIVDIGASIGFGLIRGITRSLGSARGSLLDSFITGLMGTTSGELKKEIERKGTGGQTYPPGYYPPGSFPPTQPGHPPPAGGTRAGALGLDDWVTKPTLFLAGERGPERVQVTPQGRTSGGNIININISGRNAEEISRTVIRRLREKGI